MAAGYFMITYASLGFVMENTSRGHLSVLFPCHLDVKSVWLVNKTLSSRASGVSLSDDRVCRPGRSLGSSREIVAVRTPQHCSSVLMRAMSQVVLGTPQCRNGMGSASGWTQIPLTNLHLWAVLLGQYQPSATGTASPAGIVQRLKDLLASLWGSRPRR